MDAVNGFDLEAYLRRIGFEADPAPDPGTLGALHAAHLDRIPFENVDVYLGRGVRLDLGSLQDKLVARGRGGYCFEHNTLFAAALRAIGFEVATLEARVRPPGATAPLPRTHMLLRVAVGRDEVLADVGFGGDGPPGPVPLDGTPTATHRVVPEGDDVRALRTVVAGTWRDLYAFRSTPAEAVDFEVANHFTSTHPRSPFVTTLTVQRRARDARHVLRGRTYTEIRDGAESVREVADADLGDLLRDVFALDLPPADLDAVVRKARVS